MATDNLQRLAREFGGTVQRVLNMTVCRSVRISVVVSEPGKVLVGYGLGKASLRTARFPVASGRCWLDVAYRLRLDDQNRFLAVEASHTAVFAADDDRSCLCRYDYERGKQDYPEAHLQVYGACKALASWAGAPRTR